MIINLYGGPKHGKRVMLPDDAIAFLRADGGHYARVKGGLANEFYWYDGVEAPFAVEQNGHLIPVKDYIHKDI